jgi:hypothetical protein
MDLAEERRHSQSTDEEDAKTGSQGIKRSAKK